MNSRFRKIIAMRYLPKSYVTEEGNRSWFFCSSPKDAVKTRFFFEHPIHMFQIVIESLNWRRFFPKWVLDLDQYTRPQFNLFFFWMGCILTSTNWYSVAHILLLAHPSNLQASRMIVWRSVFSTSVTFLIFHLFLMKKSIMLDNPALRGGSDAPRNHWEQNPSDPFIFSSLATSFLALALTFCLQPIQNTETAPFTNCQCRPFVFPFFSCSRHCTDVSLQEMINQWRP